MSGVQILVDNGVKRYLTEDKVWSMVNSLSPVEPNGIF